jgi:hypothetical protein
MLFEIDNTPSFRIHLYNHSVANKWKNLVKESFVGDGSDIDHRRSFLFHKTKEDIQHDLVKAIENINKSLKRNVIELPETIDWQDEDFYNKLHYHFETLGGTFDNPSNLYLGAPKHLQESIMDLNFCVHQLEKDSKDRHEKLEVQWTKTREKLKRIKFEEDEYQHIKFSKTKHEVYLGYNEVGKNYIDLWRDNLPVDYKELQNNHYIGLNFFVSLIDKPGIFENEFVSWMEKHKIDPYNKKLGIGLMPIGKCEMITMNHLTKDSKVNIIYEHEEKN